MKICHLTLHHPSLNANVFHVHVRFSFVWMVSWWLLVIAVITLQCQARFARKWQGDGRKCNFIKFPSIFCLGLATRKVFSINNNNYRTLYVIFYNSTFSFILFSGPRLHRISFEGTALFLLVNTQFAFGKRGACSSWNYTLHYNYTLMSVLPTLE